MVVFTYPHPHLHFIRYWLRNIYTICRIKICPIQNCLLIARPCKCVNSQKSAIGILNSHRKIHISPLPEQLTSFWPGRSCLHCSPSDPCLKGMKLLFFFLCFYAWSPYKNKLYLNQILLKRNIIQPFSLYCAIIFFLLLLKLFTLFMNHNYCIK